MKNIIKVNVLFLILFMPCFIHAKSYNYEGRENRKNVNFKHGGTGIVIIRSKQ